LSAPFAKRKRKMTRRQIGKCNNKDGTKKGRKGFLRGERERVEKRKIASLRMLSVRTRKEREKSLRPRKKSVSGKEEPRSSIETAALNMREVKGKGKQPGR